MGNKEEPIRGTVGCTFNQRSRSMQRKTDPVKPGSLIPVHISFDATEQVEVDGEVKLGRTDGMSRAVYVKGWMLDMYGYTK